MTNSKTQKEYTYERLQRVRAEYLEANKTIGNRASYLIAGGMAVVAFFISGKLANLERVDPVVIVLLGAVTSLALFIYWLICMANVSQIRGLLDKTKVWHDLAQDEEQQLTSFILDEVDAIQKEKSNHELISGYFNSLAICIALQILLVLCGAFLSSYIAVKGLDPNIPKLLRKSSN